MFHFGFDGLHGARVVSIVAGLCAVSLTADAQARTQPSVEYDVSFERAAQHEARVVATFRGIAAGTPLRLRMSRSSPGRYAVHEFAKNVYDVSAVDGAGRAVMLTRPDPYGWDAHGHNGVVTVTYTVWGDRVDGTYLAVDETHGHMNMPATFMWARGLERAPVRLRVRPRDGWRVVTQLRPTADPMVFTAANLQWFLDSPTEAGPVTLRELTFAGDTFRLAVHHHGTEAQVDSFALMTRDVIAEQYAIWGESPRFDYGTYTFIADYLPWASGDAMEHRNSTVLTNRAGLADRAARVSRLGPLSHELFHAWSVERLRPRALEPFDFERANMTDDLWFAEGFTSYYGPLAVRRAGWLTDDEYVNQLAGAIIATIESPARAYGSPMDMSRRAPFADAATSIDPTPFSSIFLSYYTWGAAVGAGLDLTLRDRFSLTLDDYMRRLWRDYGRSQNPDRSPARTFTHADLRATLGRLTGDTAFANDYFRRFIEGREVPDYKRLLARAGILLAGDSVPRPYLGASLGPDSAGVFVNWSAANGSLHPAGIGNGDIIHAVDGVPVADSDSLSARMARYRVGDTVAIDVTQRIGRRTVPVKLVGLERLRMRTYEQAGLPVTAELRDFRDRWLGSKAAAGGRGSP